MWANSTGFPDSLEFKYCNPVSVIIEKMTIFIKYHLSMYRNPRFLKSKLHLNARSSVTYTEVALQ